MKKTTFSHTHTANESLEQIRAQDMKAIFLMYYPRLAYFAESLLNNVQEAEDIASAALSKLWEMISGPEPERIHNLQAWLFTVVRNACYNYLKHQRVKRKSDQYMIVELEDINEDIEARLIEEDIVNKLFTEIYQLPSRCKQVAELIYIQGYTAAEVSRELGIAPSTVRSQQARAIDLIRTSFIRKKIFVDPAISLLFLLSLDRYAY